MAELDSEVDIAAERPRDDNTRFAAAAFEPELDDPEQFGGADEPDQIESAALRSSLTCTAQSCRSSLRYVPEKGGCFFLLSSSVLASIVAAATQSVGFFFFFLIYIYIYFSVIAIVRQ